jgi:hypothetical protein
LTRPRNPHARAARRRLILALLRNGTIGPEAELEAHAGPPPGGVPEATGAAGDGGVEGPRRASLLVRREQAVADRHQPIE